MCTIKQSPGKFEGETCITHLMHTWANDGVLNYEGCPCNGNDDGTNECECPPVSVAFSPFTLGDVRDVKATGVVFCDECVKDFLAASTIRYWEDSQGFAYSEIL